MWRNVIPVGVMLFVLLATFGGLSYFDPGRHHVEMSAKKTDRLSIP